ncbi:MAG: ankyrin repeat domain-containing protein [Candidatus Endonucleobacter bathymodioli]|uniref:Ankyrin repeat domain-containing protein n=1 Tax=Candidatus Endonucleibacter bathymodioli TaxID=539814 RepID=A0AA90P361_9GAMM|nr:ankyrin repeat domain-containing protein [Candidatus Endonucleobacter bathymodioli]
MKNTLSIIITLSILLSGSSMAALDSILEQRAKLEISATNSNIGNRSGTCSHLDALIANNKAIPEAWLPQPCCEHEDRLKKEMGIINKQDLKDYLSQFEDCEDVADKLFILKDHEYYHYILFQTVMGLRRHCSTNELGISYHSIDKDAEGLQACGNIIQETIKSLTLEDRPFEERPCSISKYSSVSSIKVGCKEKELELEPLQSNDSNSCKTDKASENYVRSSVLLYMSEGAELCLNCKVYRNGEVVECRHLAAWWLKLKEFEYGDIDSRVNIARCKKIPYSAELDKSFSCGRCPSEGIYFEISQFPKVICDVATSLSEGEEKRYFIKSSIHSMGICIKMNEYNNIIIYYYDPNDTLRHKEIIVNTVGDLKYLRHDDFWDPIHLYSYFPGQDKACCLHSLDTKASQQDCKIVCLNKPSANLMYLLGKFGHYGYSEAFFDLKDLDRKIKKELFAGQVGSGTSALYIACQNGHLEAVSALLEMIINIDLDPDVKKELLAGRREDGTSPLFIACQNGDNAIVSVLIAGIFSGDLNLSNGEKAELLTGKRKDKALLHCI